VTAGTHGLDGGRLVPLATADLHVYEQGPPDGPPVILLHGFLTSAFTWRQVWPTLAQRHRVVLVDLPGCGRSPDPRIRDWSAARCADLLVELFDALELTAPAVVGSQMGGSVAAWLAGTHTDRIGKLIVMAAGALGEGATNLSLYRALATPFVGPVLARCFPRGLFAAKWAAVHGPGHEPDPDAVATYHQQLQLRGTVMARVGLGIRLSYGESFDALASLIAGLPVPTLLLFGEADRLVPPTTGLRFSELLPDSRLILLPGCGDFPQEERSNEVAAAIRTFLEADT